MLPITRLFLLYSCLFLSTWSGYSNCAFIPPSDSHALSTALGSPSIIHEVGKEDGIGANSSPYWFAEEETAVSMPVLQIREMHDRDMKKRGSQESRYPSAVKDPNKKISSQEAMIQKKKSVKFPSLPFFGRTNTNKSSSSSDSTATSKASKKGKLSKTKSFITGSLSIFRRNSSKDSSRRGSRTISRSGSFSPERSGSFRDGGSCRADSVSNSNRFLNELCPGEEIEPNQLTREARRELTSDIGQLKGEHCGSEMNRKRERIFRHEVEGLGRKYCPDGHVKQELLQRAPSPPGSPSKGLSPPGVPTPDIDRAPLMNAVREHLKSLETPEAPNPPSNRPPSPPRFPTPGLTPAYDYQASFRAVRASLDLTPLPPPQPAIPAGERNSEEMSKWITDLCSEAPPGATADGGRKSPPRSSSPRSSPPGSPKKPPQVQTPETAGTPFNVKMWRRIETIKKEDNLISSRDKKQ